MQQAELIPAEPQAADVSHVAPDSGLNQFADLRHLMMTLPPEQQNIALEQYKASRDNFRNWLKAQLKEGIHYGYCPGTEPKYDAQGNQVVKSWDKRANDGKGGYKESHISPRSWQAKPPLYKAGAEFIVDLMGLRPKYEADEAGWRQLGGKPGMFVYKCILISRKTEEIVGEGTGARTVGQKGGDENNAIKMCQKSAMVCAVLNSYGLSDLFTQDVEDGPPPARPNVERNQGAPKAEPRGKRPPTKEPLPKEIAPEQIKFLLDRWKETMPDPTPEAWDDYAQTHAGRIFNVRKASCWTIFDVRAIREALGIPGDEELGNAGT